MENQLQEENKTEEKIGFLKKNLAQVIIFIFMVLLTLMYALSQDHLFSRYSMRLAVTFSFQPIVWFLCSVFFRKVWYQIIVWFIFEYIWVFFLTPLILHSSTGFATFFYLIGSLPFLVIGLFSFSLISLLRSYLEARKLQEISPYTRFKFYAFHLLLGILLGIFILVVLTIVFYTRT